MNVKATLGKLIDTLCEARQREVLDFAEFLSWQEERDGWRELGQASLARAYGPDEPEYSLADIRPGSGE